VADTDPRSPARQLPPRQAQRRMGRDSLSHGCVGGGWRMCLAFPGHQTPPRSAKYRAIRDGLALPASAPDATPLPGRVIADNAMRVRRPVPIRAAPSLPEV
jgi:hypothetical protein